MAKNTGKGSRKGAVRNRTEFKRGSTYFKRDTKTGQILNGSPKTPQGCPRREVAPQFTLTHVDPA